VKLDRGAAGRLLEAFELHAAGVEIMRENLRRRRPRASRHEIERALARWLAEQPSGGDLVHGRWPRSR
jgi:hypothetical protein